MLLQIQSHCLSLRAFRSCKYGKRGMCGFQKMDAKCIPVITSHGKSVKRIDYRHHTCKALLTSDISVVKTAEKVGTYQFQTENGRQLKVLVEKTSKKYRVHVEVLLPMYSGREGYMVVKLGVFRSNSENFVPLLS